VLCLELACEKIDLDQLVNFSLTSELKKADLTESCAMTLSMANLLRCSMAAKKSQTYSN
jgi:hypothetical protein